MLTTVPVVIATAMPDVKAVFAADGRTFLGCVTESETPRGFYAATAADRALGYFATRDEAVTALVTA